MHNRQSSGCERGQTFENDLRIARVGNVIREGAGLKFRQGCAATLDDVQTALLVMMALLLSE